MKGFLLSPRRSGSSGLLLSLRRSLVGRVLGCLSVWSSLPAWRVCLHACGVGLSLICFWSISVPPVRGGTYFSLPPQRKVGKRKRLKPLMLSGHRSLQQVVVHLESVFVHLHTLVTRASYLPSRTTCSPEEPFNKPVVRVILPHSQLLPSTSVARATRNHPIRRIAEAKPTALATWESAPWFSERLFGARSAAGRMTPLSLTPNVREHRFHGATGGSELRFPLSISGLSCFLLPTFLCSRQRKVGAAPHRGNAGKPKRTQGKANPLRTTTKTKAPQATSGEGRDKKATHPLTCRRQ